MSEDLEYPNWVEGESDKDLIEEFFSEVKKKYPDLSESIDWNEDLMHISMGDLQRHAEEMCKSGKLEELKECFEWVEGYFCRSRHELLNAFNVSFLEYFEHQGLSGVSGINACQSLSRLSGTEEVHGKFGQKG